jgi:hypothetical protein|tara:strand:+ start:660 stop:2393 length:1734 start_codon:yes stop_codon:yes gene_type:complete
MVDQTRRDRLDRHLAQLKIERESFISHYKDLSTFVKPRRGRFEIRGKVNDGTKVHNSIINSAGTQAHNTAQAGMFAGVMAPTRPWFAFGPPDREMRKFKPVQNWLHDTAARMRSVFNRSNLYTMAPTMIGELLLFGTGAMAQMDDNETVTRFATHTVGSYMIGQNDKAEINTFAHEYQMTAEQMAMKFGVENISVEVKEALRTGKHSWFPVVQMIEENQDFIPGGMFAKNKQFCSVRYEPHSRAADRNKYLSISGFDDFPIYVPRWGLTGEDVYGTDCPGMVALGDIRGLQVSEKQKAMGIQKMVNPPLTGPPSLKNVNVSTLPGSLNIYSGDPTRNKLEPVYQVNLPLHELKEDIAATERRINNAFFVDLFLAISNMEGVQPRNELELSERNAERLLQLGPVLERMQIDFADRMISNTFKRMMKEELLTPAPPELEDQELEIEYISSLAQAQRAVDTKSIDRLSQFVGGLMQAGMSDGKKFDADKAIEEYATLIGTPPNLISGDEAIAAERQQEQQQAQQAQMAEMASKMAPVVQAAGQAAGAAGQIADLDLGGDTIAARLAGGGGGGEPPPESEA